MGMERNGPWDRKTLVKDSKKRKGLPEGVGPRDIIEKTATAKGLSRGDIFGFINDIVDEHVDSEQIGAWLMAARLKGLTAEETIYLTMAMATSGKVLDLESFGKVTDKHSSGGVGDTTTLVVGPLVAACDVLVGKMSGRGLGHTGGTLDKFEAIPNATTSLTVRQFKRQLEKIGLVLAGQTSDLAPADAILYGTRDRTSTVMSIPLIAASIMSKKIAAGPNTLVLDVTMGRGAFMRTRGEARSLAKTMVDIGKSVGIDCMAEITEMDQPRGPAVGNGLEVNAAIIALRGGGPKEFRKYCVETAARIVRLSGKTPTLKSAVELVEKNLRSGMALQKFGEMVEAQGGNRHVIDRPEQILPKAKYQKVVLAARSGYIEEVNALTVGTAAMKLGAGRERKGDKIDMAVGVIVGGRVGDRVEKGQPLFTIHANKETRIESAAQALSGSVRIVGKRVSPLRSVYEVVK